MSPTRYFLARARVCVCVRAYVCVCVCVRACVRVRVCVVCEECNTELRLYIISGFMCRPVHFVGRVKRGCVLASVGEIRRCPNDRPTSRHC